MPSSRGSSQLAPLMSPAMAGGFLTSSATWNLMCFNVWFPKKGKREKWRGSKKHWPFKSLRSHFSLWEWSQQQWGKMQQNQPPASSSALLWSEAATSNHSTDSWYMEDRDLFAHPGSFKLCASCPRNCAQLPTVGLRAGIGSCYCAKSWNWPK